jgi:hypothetical protein
MIFARTRGANEQENDDCSKNSVQCSLFSVQEALRALYRTWCRAVSVSASVSITSYLLFLPLCLFSGHSVCLAGSPAVSAADEPFCGFPDSNTVSLWLFDEPNCPGVTVTDAGSNWYDLRLASGSDEMFAVSLSGDAAAFTIEDTAAGLATRLPVDQAELADGRWHHVAFTRTGGDEIRLYLDGRLQKTAEPDPTQGRTAAGR